MFLPRSNSSYPVSSLVPPLGTLAGLVSAFRAGRLFDHVTRVVSVLGFSVPTYWLGLTMLFVFFYLLGWAPPGMGRISLMVTPPDQITGSYLLDALLAGDWEAARSQFRATGLARFVRGHPRRGAHCEADAQHHSRRHGVRSSCAMPPPRVFLRPWCSAWRSETVRRRW